MTKILSRAARQVVFAFSADPAAIRMLEQTHVEVRRNSRLWGI